jgi:outer membrane protein with beta-barrel domain
VRKYLGVLAGTAALCVTSWAQAPAQGQTPDQSPAQAQTPAQTPAQPQTQTQPPEAAPIPPSDLGKKITLVPFPRVEFFVGGTYAEAGFYNAGHWAGLPGWDTSLGLNVTHWFGFIVEGGEYFGTFKIPTNPGNQLPFPPCPQFCPNTSPTFDATTREYNILFGGQVARRKYERWTPRGEFLYGHQGVRGIANGSGAQVTEVGTGRAFVAGGGVDYKINPRFALRLNADYFQTGTDFLLLGKKKQDNFRVSVGIVIRNVHKKRRTLEEETQTQP